MQRVYVTSDKYPAMLSSLLSRQPGAAIKAMRKAAREGHTRVVAATKTAGVRASGTFERSWTVVQTPKGAIIGNSAKHAYFVEVGRRPGVMPPRGAIAEWLLQRKLVRQTAKGNKRVAAMRIAFPIARAIGRRGTEGYFLMKSVLPSIDKSVKRETREAWRRLGRR